VGCRTVEAKRTLIRIVRTPEGLKVDPKGKMPGRGAYLHDRRSCWQAGLNGRLAQSLKTNMSEDDLADLTDFMETLPEDESAG
jgi:predicted RNA-binding protein YlxR (DUF448 family)